MNGEYAQRHVVVTGGTGALGSAVVERLLERGAECHVPARDASELERLAWRSHPRVRVATGIDLTDERPVHDFYAPLDGLWASIHVAGGFSMSPITETDLDAFRRMIDLNAVTCFLCCREAVRKIRTGGDGGRIVNVAAKPAIVPVGGMTAYAASKAAVASITQCLAEELADERIWVNAIVPSIMDTPANRKAMPHADHAKWPTVAEVAATIVFLASPQNESTRQALVPVYGRS